MKLAALASRLREEFFPVRDEFDQAHGTDTSGLVSLWHLRVCSPNKKFGIRYQPCDTAVFRAATEEVERSRTFIDLGCGKGRVLIMAHETGFQRVIGVEFSPMLAKIARRQCPFAEVVTGDAARYVFPNDPLCIFMYNPFGPAVLNEAIAHLPGNSLVVYAAPRHPVDLPTVRVGTMFRVYRT